MEAAGRVPGALATGLLSLAGPLQSLQPRLQCLPPPAFLGHLGPETTLFWVQLCLGWSSPSPQPASPPPGPCR